MNTHHGNEPAVVGLVDDVFFMATIASAATAVGVDVVFPGGRVPLPSRPQLVLVDLQFRGDWERLVGEYAEGGVRVIGFGPHLDSEAIRRGRAAGCGRVMAKSKFVRELAGLLSSLRQATPRVPEGSSG